MQHGVRNIQASNGTAGQKKKSWELELEEAVVNTYKPT